MLWTAGLESKSFTAGWRNGLKWRILGSNTKSKTVVQRKGLGCKVCPVRKGMWHQLMQSRTVLNSYRPFKLNWHSAEFTGCPVRGRYDPLHLEA